MKRTLIVATTSYAGMGPYVSEIVNVFSPTDDVFFFFHDYEDDYFKKNVNADLHENSVFIKQANSSINKLKELLMNKFSYQGLILDFCKKKHIEQVHFINGCPSVPLQRTFSKLGISVIGTVHDLHPHEAKKAWYKMLRFRINAKRMHDAILYCSNLITNSPHQLAELRSILPPKKVFYHAFPSLVSKCVMEGNESVPELVALDKPYILFFGRIEEYKGLELLYTAFLENQALSDKYYLVIAGSGQVSFSRSTEERNVIWVNRYVKDSEVAKLYKNAKCVVYPYLSATQSGVLSLAFYFQVLTLASDVPFFKSIIQNGETGLLFEKGNKEDLAKKLLAIISLDESKFSEQQRKYYLENYEGLQLRKNLLRIYSEC